MSIPEDNAQAVERVAFFLGALGGGGAERVTLDLAEGFRAAGFLVDVVVADASGPLVAQIPTGVRLVRLGVRRTVFAVPRLRAYLRRCRPSVLIGAMAHANSIAVVSAALARTGTRVVAVEHVNLSAETRAAVALRGKVLPYAARRTYPHAHAVVAVSEGVADDLAELIGLKHSAIRVIKNPIRYDAIERAASAPLGRRWMSEANVPVVVAAGRLTLQKDFAMLIRAFATLRRECDVRLVILGEGPERHTLEELARSLGVEADVDLVGFVTNPYAVIGRADVLALSSQWEGLPTVLLEALALGTPIVATDCPNGPREILRGGRLGTLVPMQDVPAMAHALGAAIARGRVQPVRVAEHELNFVVDAYAAAGGISLPRASASARTFR